MGLVHGPSGNLLAIDTRARKYCSGFDHVNSYIIIAGRRNSFNKEVGGMGESRDFTLVRK